jgi:RNA polymerase sporulation-specific sigma factor
MKDEEILKGIREGNKEYATYLVEKYTEFVEKIARKYYIPGQEFEDVMQEGLIGFFEAVKYYREESGLPFQNFAYYCIKKNIFDAIQAAHRKKRVPPDETISLEMSSFYEKDRENRLKIIDQIFNRGNINPEDIVILKSLVKEIVNVLSDMERKILKRHLEGKSYFEISKELKIPEKAVGNALQRARKKIKEFFLEEIKKR